MQCKKKSEQRYSDRQIDKYADIQIHSDGWRNGQVDNPSRRQASGQTDRQTEHADELTDRR